MVAPSHPSGEAAAQPHPLRPAGEEGRLWDAAAAVADPEIPVISIADLGILRAARLINHRPTITITPTYSGCPAMETITADIRSRCRAAGFGDVVVETQLSPAWTTAWMTERGAQQLREYGITPPQPLRTRGGPIPIELSIPRNVPCPRCGSTDTRKLAHFGSTSCKALYSCNNCHEPFDYFKAH